MKKIHSNTKKRYELGSPFEELLELALKSTNTGNLSNNWNQTDMARFLIVKGWESVGKVTPVECKNLLKKFYSDFNL